MDDAKRIYQIIVITVKWDHSILYFHQWLMNTSKHTEIKSQCMSRTISSDVTYCQCVYNAVSSRHHSWICACSDMQWSTSSSTPHSFRLSTSIFGFLLILCCVLYYLLSFPLDLNFSVMLYVLLCHVTHHILISQCLSLSIYCEKAFYQNKGNFVLHEVYFLCSMSLPATIYLAWCAYHIMW